MSVTSTPSLVRSDKPHQGNGDSYSPGLEGVIAGETAISSVAGGLQYRGYAIEDLAEHATFEEVAYLLLYGELPTPTQLLYFKTRLGMFRGVPEPVLQLVRLIPPRTPAMDALRTAVSLIAHFDSDPRDRSHEANVQRAERLIAVIPALIAARFRLKHDREPILPPTDLGHAASFLTMLTGAPVAPEHARAFDVSLILYAEHEFNASTFACRVTASTQSDLYSAVTSGVGTLEGPLHGGANEEAIKLLLQVGNPDRARAWVSKALSEKRLIMGFGHRVYKTVDPRAEIVRRYCQSIARQREDLHLEAAAEVIERTVKAQKGLPPNVDWPVARLYYYLGLEVELYTPIFVAARVAGWCAHIIEQLDHNRIFRPVGRYIGAAPRKVVPPAERNDGSDVYVPSDQTPVASGRGKRT